MSKRGCIFMLAGTLSNNVHITYNNACDGVPLGDLRICNMHLNTVFNLTPIHTRPMENDPLGAVVGPQQGLVPFTRLGDNRNMLPFTFEAFVRSKFQTDESMLIILKMVYGVMTADQMCYTYRHYYNIDVFINHVKMLLDDLENKYNSCGMHGKNRPDSGMTRQRVYTPLSNLEEVNTQEKIERLVQGLPVFVRNLFENALVPHTVIVNDQSNEVEIGESVLIVPEGLLFKKLYQEKQPEALLANRTTVVVRQIVVNAGRPSTPMGVNTTNNPNPVNGKLYVRTHTQ